mmetsp:Transcript_106979/g.185873  ORF Transcript_106979/g.185873 Transcript_106979/m.185873 type:complete len:173 (+) Transcript_106979:52-570(+)
MDYSTIHFLDHDSHATFEEVRDSAKKTARFLNKNLKANMQDPLFLTAGLNVGMGPGAFTFLNDDKENKPEKEVIEIERGEEKLGIDIECCDDTTLLVRKVAPGGIVDKYNHQNPHKQLQPGDLILEINGVKGICYGSGKGKGTGNGRGKTTSMLERIQKDETLRLTVKKHVV